MRLGLGIGINRRIGGGGTPAPGPTNTVAPVVSGTPEIGEDLSSTTGSWTGNGTITYAYQWLRNGANIAAATANTYTLVSADDLTTVSCRVTATDDDGSRAANSNGVAVTEVVPANTVAPVASGSTGLGSLLSVTNGTWTGDSITYSYQWQRGGVDISGATANTYTIVAADDAAAVRCVVTATNSGGGVSANSNAITVDDFAIPVITGAPSISGTEEIGSTLTATPASVAGNPTPSRTWQWYRSGSPISGATSITYSLVAADGSNTITVQQIETNALGSDDATSTATGTIPPLAAPVITGVPTISGTTTENETLTATPASVSGNPTSTRTWQWRRDGVDISGATSITYVLVTADVGTVISVRQIETNSQGGDDATSADTATIAAAGGGSRRNLLTYTEDLTNAAWSKSSVTATVDTITATGATSRVFQAGVSLTASTEYTYSVKLKGGTSPFAAIRAVGYNAGQPGAWLDLSTGTIGTVGTGLTASVDAADGDGFYRFQVSFTLAADTVGDFSIYLANTDNTYATTAGNTLLVKEAQLEVGSPASAYQAILGSTFP